MPQSRRDEPTRDREKQKMHGAPSDQGGERQRLDAVGEPEAVYEAPEETNQQRRAE